MTICAVGWINFLVGTTLSLWWVVLTIPLTFSAAVMAVALGIYLVDRRCAIA